MLLQFCFKKSKHKGKYKLNHLKMRMRLSLFMTKACPWVKWLTFFWRKQKALLHKSVQLFFASSLLFQAQSLVYSHHFLCSAQPLAYFYGCPKALWNWSIQEVDWFFQQRLVGIHRLNFIFSCSILGHRERRDTGGGGGGGGEGGGERDGWDARLSATL